MSGGSRVGAPGCGGIPANARKVVQDLKEIVKNSDEEIYAMLKECNMDPNETVQRLINQDTFHEVKRKRDKKKENVNKESGEARSRPSGVGPSMRGGRVPDRGTGRGNYIPRYNSELSGGGRGQSLSGRENGLYQNARSPSTPTASTSSVQPQAHIKTFSTGTSGSNSVAASTASGSSGTPNGSSPYTRASQGPRGSWSAASGQATMADIVKSNSAPQHPVTPATVPSLPTSTPQQYIPSTSNVSPGVYSSSTDPVLHSYLESRAAGPVGTAKRDVGTVGNQRSMGDQAPALSVEASSMPESSLHSPQISQPRSEVLDCLTTETDVKAIEAEIPSTSVTPSLTQDRSVTQLSTMDVGGLSEGPAGTSSSGPAGSSGARVTLIGNQYNGRAVYQTQQQHLGSQKVAGSGLEWKPKSPVKSTVSSQAVAGTSSVSEAARSPPPASPEGNMGTLSDATTKLQRLSMQDDQPVIIPNHLQVAEADRSHLSFGSFGADFDASFSTNFASEDESKSPASVEDNTPAVEAPTEQPSDSSLMSSAPVSLDQNYTQESTATPVETLAASNDVAITMPAPVISPAISPVVSPVISPVISQPEISKPEPIVHQSPQYPYPTTIPNYHGFGIVPQIMGGQYTYEPAESQPQEVSRLPSFVSPYSDPGTNYYSPVFRASSDADARYTHFVSTNAANKYNTGVTLMTGQCLSSSQEGGNSLIIPATGPTGQTSQTVGIAQTALTIPQQPVPIHAYPAQPAGVPISPFGANIFGFQYVPPSYTYMHTPYQHSYTGSTGYPQAPTGSSYAPAGGGTYPPAGAAAVKYSLPQYKPGTSGGNAPHAAVAAGYGSFTTAPSGYAVVNPVVSASSASGYDDVGGPQYKESNLYIPSQQQAEGSAVWIQAQLSRDMTGMQTNSFYNMLGQGQHTGYAHTQPTHALPAAGYANLYHQSQSGPSPSGHQLLQQPQALGAVGAGGAQAGAYQQPQRGQLNWTNSY